MGQDATRGSGTRPEIRRSFPESKMRAVVMIVADVVSEQTLQMAFVNCDDVIQEFPAAAAYPTLRNSILPRAPQRSADRTRLQRSNSCGDLQPVLRIPVENEKPGSRCERKRLSQLLDDPPARGVLSNVEVQNAPPVVVDDEKAIEHPESDRWAVKESIAAIPSQWSRRKASRRLAGSGFLGARFIQREIVLSESSKPSMRSSPWMRGAPQVGFSATIRKINSRTSFDVDLLPTGALALEISLQYRRNPARCQRTTDSGVTMMRECLQADQTRRATTQKSLSKRPTLVRGCRGFSTASC